MQTTKPRFNLGKASFIATLLSGLFLIVFWTWIYRFHKYYPGGGLEPQLLNDLWLGLFGLSVIATPLFAIIGLVGGVVTKWRKPERSKGLALASIVLSLLVLALYSLYFIPLPID